MVSKQVFVVNSRKAKASNEIITSRRYLRTPEYSSPSRVANFVQKNNQLLMIVIEKEKKTVLIITN